MDGVDRMAKNLNAEEADISEVKKKELKIKCEYGGEKRMLTVSRPVKYGELVRRLQEMYQILLNIFYTQSSGEIYKCDRIRDGCILSTGFTSIVTVETHDCAQIYKYGDRDTRIVHRFTSMVKRHTYCAQISGEIRHPYSSEPIQLRTHVFRIVAGAVETRKFPKHGAFGAQYYVFLKSAFKLT
ncbi:hypothetical protein Btru_008330 [Bulinus truncatus]|nr:hypothetical protein Btru_008330 [Bulinus truncatus]